MPTEKFDDSLEPGPEEPHSSDGSEELDELFVRTYDELRRLASALKHSFSKATINPTALVDEAYLRLAGSLQKRPESRLHFKRIAARSMRQILIEAARRRNAQKRGGGDVILVTLDNSSEQVASSDKELLAVDAALKELARFSPRQASMVEWRFFAGFDIPEIAAMLNVSEATVLRDWRSAKAWLATELRRTF